MRQIVTLMMDLRLEMPVFSHPIEQRNV